MTWAPVLKKQAPRATRQWRSNDEILGVYREHLEKNHALNVAVHYPRDVAAFMRMWGETLVTQLQDPDIQLFVDTIGKKCSRLHMSSPPRCHGKCDIAACPLLLRRPESEWASCAGYRPLDPAGTLSYIRTLQSFYGWLLEEGHVAANPADPVMSRFLRQNKGVLQERKRKPRRRGWELEHIRKTVLGSPIHRAIILALMAKCFLRIHEVMKLSLDPRFWNWDEGWADIPYSYKHGNKRIGQNHRIIIDAELRMLLERYLEWRERRVKRDAEGKPVTDLLVIATTGLPWCTNGFQGNYRTMLRKDLARLGIITGQETERHQRLTPHGLRAFATKWARDHGASDADLQVLRGDKAPGAIGVYDDHLHRLPNLYRLYAPVLGI